jgi:chromosome segregation ATPase
MQALSLSKDLATKRSGEATLQSRIAELEWANGELRVEFGQANDRAKEMEARKNAVTAGYQKLSQKHKDLQAKAEAWQQEKTEIKKSCQDRVDKVEEDYLNYRVNFGRSLQGFRHEIEAVLGGLGAQCLPYPAKDVPIEEIFNWFEEEVKSLS